MGATQASNVGNLAGVQAPINAGATAFEAGPEVRAKFYVHEVTEYQGGGKKVVLNAMYDDGLPENKRFNKASPSGTLEVWIDNPPAAAKFTPGKRFYLDFTEAPDSPGFGG